MFEFYMAELLRHPGTVRVTAKVQGKTFTLNIKQAAVIDSDVSTA
ncbi:hypothetical protein A1Y9_05110, partial [Escherichia coli KTE121]